MSSYPGPPAGGMRPPVPGNPGYMQNQLHNQMPGPPVGMPNQPPSSMPNQMTGPKGNIPPPMMMNPQMNSSGIPPHGKVLPQPNMSGVSSQPPSFNGVGGIANHVGPPQPSVGFPPRTGLPASPQNNPYPSVNPMANSANASPHVKEAGSPVSQHGPMSVRPGLIPGQGGYPRPGLSQTGMTPPNISGQQLTGMMSTGPPTSGLGPPQMRQPGPPFAPQTRPGPPIHTGLAPRPGMPPPYSHPGMPPVSQSMIRSTPPMSLPVNSAAPPPPMNSANPNELPVPFHGQGQYSHQVKPGQGISPAVTPGHSEPPSAKSSRSNSPVQSGAFDAMEGQFSPEKPPGPQGDRQRFPGAGTPPISAIQPPIPSQVGGMSYPPVAQVNQMPGPPQPGMRPPPPPTSQTSPQYSQPSIPRHPPPSGTQMSGGQTGFPPPVAPQPMYGQTQPTPQGAPGQVPYGNNLSASFNNMSLGGQGESRAVNLLQEKNILPLEGLPIPKPSLPPEYKKVTCNAELFRCTVGVIPQTQSLLNKSRLPLGILIHPFKDLSQLPVIQSSVIVRCRSCRTYINPFVTFVDMRRWKCNLCYRVNELPEEFSYDPISKSYGEPQRRPEIKSSTIEFIAPSEYMMRPPQPAVYLYVLDVSYSAISSGYLQTFCQTLLDELDRIPGDSRTMIGFITFDSSLHFYNLGDNLSQPQMLVVSDIDEIFLPCPDGLLVNLHESRELVVDLLNQLPNLHNNNLDSGCAYGPALQAAHKLMSSTGGRVTTVLTQLPSVGAGALKNREDPNDRAGKKVQNLGPATDFYKKMALDSSAQQVAMDLFVLNSQYIDIATIACIAKYSSGSLNYYPGFHSLKNSHETERFENDLRRYITRKIGFEAVMRTRCTKGLSIHTFHGNFFVRSTDLISLANVNPDAGFGMQISIEDTLNEGQNACFQAALLYTSSKGERRIRVHTLCLPIVTSISDIYAAADQQAIIGLLAKMAVDKSVTGSLSDARDAMINAAVDMIGAYGNACISSSQRIGSVQSPHSLRLIPVYILAMLKHVAFRVGSSTRLDERVFAMEQCKTMPTSVLMLHIYPDLYPVHMLDEKTAKKKNGVIVCQPPHLQLSSANIDRHGVYLMDAGSYLYMWIGSAVSDQFCTEVFGASNFASIQHNTIELPELENETSERLRNFLSYLQDQRPFFAPLKIIREDSQERMQFISRLVEDRTESSMSYYEFLQHIQKEIKA